MAKQVPRNRIFAFTRSLARLFSRSQDQAVTSGHRPAHDARILLGWRVPINFVAIITGLAEDVGAIADGILAFLKRSFQAVHSSGRERRGELGEIGVLYWHGLAVGANPAGDHNQILQFL